VEGRTQSNGRNPSANIRFGPFELDLRAAELRKDGLRIRLQEQPYQILRMLLECPGEVVLREEIRNQLWPDDTVVEFAHSINAAVMRLRDALGETADQPRYIETLPRRGYRFIGQVEAPAGVPPLVIVPRGGHTSLLARIRRTWVLVPVLMLTMILAALGVAGYYWRSSPARWAREIALPEITRLVDAEDHAAAFPLLLRALQALPEDPALNRIRRQISHTVQIRTTPPGAGVYVKPYRSADAPWLLIGQSPLQNFLLPMGFFRWRITKPGFQTVESAAGIQGSTIEFVLDPEGHVPAEMVHVPGASLRSFSGDRIHLDDFWMDRYEVTNRQFKEFIDKGGYRNRQYWRQEFIKGGRVLSWDQAMPEFRDATGRPGPSTWEVGDYSRGHEDFPVSGVSWYEAAAYAEFAHKQLPTVHHWKRAANRGIYSDILQFSNFNGSGPERVGSRPGIGAFGTYDMAGNVKEWCWNSIGSRRYILGGGWNESRPYYISDDALSPFDRSPANGIRCVKYPGGPLPGGLSAPVERPERDYRTEKPASDSVFRVLQSVYSYDRTQLKAVTESVDESSPDWRAERITFDAAYDRQRVIAWLYVPRNAKPPYQTIVFFPSGHSRSVGTMDERELHPMDFLIRSGRAVLFPEYQGTFERRRDSLGPSGERDQMIEQCKDLQRSVDYLETRTEIARGQLGYFGISYGGRAGVIILALEPRIRAAVLARVGLPGERKSPEVDEINFAPRVRVPVLMLNGRDDLVAPVETQQLPLFRWLGTPGSDKRNVLLDSGHVGPTHQYIKETLDWFDRYLGPVSR
jgi:formylglycine-generating enzyme required for sulfatase activity/DNA-binding winged helix-turn-helix (wHTH) protein